VLCGEHKEPRRSEGLQFADPTEKDDSSVFHLCDNCRFRLLWNDSGPVMAR
jgi:hypothetical protein